MNIKKNLYHIRNLKRSTRKPKSNRYSDDYKPDIEYIIENLDKAQDYTQYLAENLDKCQNWADYIAENLDKPRIEKEYEKEVRKSDKDFFNYSELHRRGFRIISKGNDYIIVENPDSHSRSHSHWIQEGDSILDSDKMTHKILKYESMPSGLYLTLDGHLKLKEGELIYVK